MRINKTLIGKDKPFVIAEIGSNHQGCLEKCKELFLSAKNAGVDAVKLQKRDNKTLFTSKMFNQPYNSENSFGRTYGEHREYLEFNKIQHLKLKQYANDLGLIFFSTPFDVNSAIFLHKEIDIPLFKIASADITNKQLIECVASFGKPIIISTGGATKKDVVRVYNLLRKKKNDFAIMHCTSSYPTETKDVNLNIIKDMKKSFKNCIIGYSSHHNGISTELIAYTLGARIFEKHFTLNRSWKGTDQSFSLEFSGMSKLVRDLNRIDEALGSSKKKFLKSENQAIFKLSKSLYTSRELIKGEKLTYEDIEVRCPGGGLNSFDIEKIVGKKIKKNLKYEHLIKMTDFER